MSDSTIIRRGPVANGDGRLGGRSRALAGALSALLVWTSAVPGIAAAQQGGGGATSLTVEHEPPADGTAGEPLRFEVRVTGSDARPFVVLHRRERGESDYRDDVIPRIGADRYLRELPTDAGVETNIEYWIEASAGDESASAGSADDPLVVGVAPAPTAAADTRAPEIVNESPASATAGEPQRFEVRVTDDSGVDDVLLFHRAGGDTEFELVPMTATGEDRYIATLPSAADTTLIEYFIEARDPSGNRDSLGSRFMPIERPLDVPASGPVAGGGGVEPAAEPRSRTLWYVVGGALLVGAIAAAAGGGGGDDDGGVTSSECCSVTIEVDPPQ